MRSNLLMRERNRRNRRRAMTAAGVVAVIALLVVAGPALLRGLRMGAGVAGSGDGAGSATNSARAGASAKAPPDASTQSDASSRPVGERTGESSTASALKTRPLSAWLGEIAREAGRDLVLSPDLRGDLTASESIKLDWKTRLEAYSRVSGFEFTLSDGLIEARRGDTDGAQGGGGAGRVRGAGVPGVARDAGERSDPSTLASANGALSPAASRSPASRGASDTATANTAPAAAPAPLPETRVVRLVHAPAKDTAAVLARAGEALDVTVAADSSSNSLVLSGLQPGLGRVLRVLTELDRPRRRIHLEAKIIEVTRSARLDLGVEWKLTGTTFGGDVKFPPNVSDAGSAALVIATHGACLLYTSPSPRD